MVGMRHLLLRYFNLIYYISVCDIKLLCLFVVEDGVPRLAAPLQKGSAAVSAPHGSVD